MTDDDVKQSILERRARFIAAAVASAGIAAVVAQGCGSTSDDGGSGGSGGADASSQDGSAGAAGARACLGMQLDATDEADGEPQPCLSPRVDASFDATLPDAGADADPDAPLETDAGPQPCLSPRP